jgi:hypothetical protein
MVKKLAIATVILFFTTLFSFFFYFILQIYASLQSIADSIWSEKDLSVLVSVSHDYALVFAGLIVALFFVIILLYALYDFLNSVLTH